MKSDVPELRTEASMLLYFSTDDRPKLPLLSVLAVRQLQIAKEKAQKRIIRKIGRRSEIWKSRTSAMTASGPTSR